ncbi:TPA: hypothetical protein ACODIZ_003589 [Salmonella enterica subsp. enterica serovar Newport]
MIIAEIVASWIVWLCLGTALTWCLKGDKAFSYTVTLLAVALVWLVWWVFPSSSTFL